ncbi:hypothetical protein MJ257_17020 [Paenibacillus timonensis]|uniref:Sigma-70 family RNA polymerase sigma factor n=1 Tax=Paenibacillus timonensis TaxID=225915 RepID=A0ABW3SEM0_9BACL|nr:hypothetical protein [Paenibacillus timonensis]MCH1641799.1 hypothetical protein [Paenibacillus timonensis]
MKVIDTHAQECYLRYREAQDNATFTDLYNALADVRSRHRSKVISSKAGDTYDADSSFDDILLSLASRDDITDIRRLLYVHLRYARIRLYHKTARWRDHTYYPEEYEEFGATVDRIQPNIVGLIRDLLDRSGDKTAALIANMTLQTDGNESISAVAGRAGVHHHAAFRPLKRLRRYYNAEMDGELAEYFA